MIKKNDKKMKKNEKKTRKIAIFQKMKNCKFPRVFFIFFIFLSFFYHFFLSFLLPVVELMQNDSKNDEK